MTIDFNPISSSPNFSYPPEAILPAADPSPLPVTLNFSASQQENLTDPSFNEPFFEDISYVFRAAINPTLNETSQEVPPRDQTYSEVHFEPSWDEERGSFFVEPAANPSETTPLQFLMPNALTIAEAHRFLRRFLPDLSFIPF